MTLTERVQTKKDELGWSWIRGEHRTKPTPALFREVENILACRLDVDYRGFVPEVGGGAFDGYVDVVGLEPNPWGGGMMPETFFGFYDEHSYDLRHQARGYKYQLPPFFVPR